MACLKNGSSPLIQKGHYARSVVMWSIPKKCIFDNKKIKTKQKKKHLSFGRSPSLISQQLADDGDRCHSRPLSVCIKIYHKYINIYI